MNYGIVEMVIFFAGMIGLGVWQLIAVERTRKRLLGRKNETKKD
jgi:hypothetical protein